MCAFYVHCVLTHTELEGVCGAQGWASFHFFQIITGIEIASYKVTTYYTPLSHVIVIRTSIQWNYYLRMRLKLHSVLNI